MSVFDATEEEIKWAAQEIQAELGALGEDLTDMPIGINIKEEGHAGSDLMAALEGMMEEEVTVIGEEATMFRDTVHKVCTSSNIASPSCWSLKMFVLMWIIHATLGAAPGDVVRSVAQVHKLAQELTDSDDANVPKQLQQVQHQSKAASNRCQNPLELDLQHAQVGH